MVRNNGVAKARACVELSLAIGSLLTAEDHIYTSGFRLSEHRRFAPKKKAEFDRIGKNLKTVNDARTELSEIAIGLGCPKTRGMQE